MSNRPLTIVEVKDRLKNLGDSMFSRHKDRRDIDKVEFESYMNEVDFLSKELNNALAKFNRVSADTPEPSTTKKSGKSTKDK